MPFGMFSFNFQPPLYTLKATLAGASKKMLSQGSYFCYYQSSSTFGL